MFRLLARLVAVIDSRVQDHPRLIGLLTMNLYFVFISFYQVTG